MTALTFTLITLSACIITYLFIYISNKRTVEKWLSLPTGEGRFFNVHNRDIYATIKGKPGTPVLIIPDIGAPAAEWWPLQDKLAEHTKVITFDRPGYGWSEKSMKPRKCKEIISEMKELLNQSDINEPVILLAHAQGALYAQFFARLYPKQVAGVVMIEPVVEYMKWQDKLNEKIISHYFDTKRFMRRYRKLATIGWLRFMRNIYKIKNSSVDSNIKNHYSNLKIYDVMDEEYSYVVDQGCLAVKIAPPFPSIPLNVIYHDSNKNIELMKRSGVKADEAIFTENTWKSMSKEYLNLSPINQWIEAENTLGKIHLEKEDLIISTITNLLKEINTVKKEEKLMMAAGA